MFHISIIIVLLFYYHGIVLAEDLKPDPEVILDSRIIGGKPASIAQFPFQVSLQTPHHGHFCGGSIVNKFFILTAAHCVAHHVPRDFRVRVGTTYSEKGGTEKSVCGILRHENTTVINPNEYDYDIALLKLCQPLAFNNNVLPVALPKSNEQLRIGAQATVTGWGFYRESGPLSRSLQQVHVTIVNHTVCRLMYRKVGKVTGRMLCAGCAKGVCDACQGDSGGPLISRGKLVGIVSWGYGCARKDFPGVYTKVTQFLRWIHTQINRNNP